MPFIIIFVILGALFLVAPKTTKYLILGPIIGIATGGFAWAIAGLLYPALITLHMFAWFLIGGIVLGEIFVAVVD